jgi:hypothetical protein
MPWRAQPDSDLGREVHVEQEAHCFRLAPRPRGSATLLAELPEFGALDRRKIASLVGVAPIANASSPSGAAHSVACST